MTAFDFEFFDMGLNRMGTDCEKWDVARQAHGQGLLPLWVADMDFKSPPQVQEALLNRGAHPTYGYTEITEKDYQAVADFWQRRHGLALACDEITLLPCVVTGLKACVEAFTQKGDGVVIQPPVYGPFFESITAKGRRIIENPLVQGEDGRYGMDFAQLERLFMEGAQLMLLCSPHNPISRVWNKGELETLAGLCRKYGVILVSDEIHADFVYKPNQFLPALGLGYENVISLCAASKTFNLAGLQQACLITKSKALQSRVQAVIDAAGIRCGNIFALCGTRAAYETGDAWLDGLMDYLDQGREILKAELERELPLAKLVPVEATYLAFMDLRAYGYSTEALMERTIKAGVMFTEGTFFSSVYGEGFMRFNFACPHRFITQGVKRLKEALL